MTEMSPEPMPLRVSTRPQTLVEVEGPGGLAAVVTIPDTDEALGALSGFVVSLPYAIQRGLGEVGDSDEDTGYGYELGGSRHA